MRFAAFAVAFSSAILIGGTSAAANVATASAEWTVMVFMNADNNLEPDGLINFRQLAQLGSSPNVNVVVQFDRIAKYAHTTPDWSQTLRFRITKDMKPLPASAIQDIGEANMGDPAVLADFVRWSRATYPAKRYMLIIWDHGQGWRFFAEQLLRRQRQLASSRSLAVGGTMTAQRSNALQIRRGLGLAAPTGETAPFRSAPGDPYRSASNDETDSDVLYNKEIHDGLSAALGGQKLDVLAFDACLMSMVETAYEMRDVARYMVASEELEPGLGWPYDQWLTFLEAHESAAADVVARAAVTAYGEYYTNTAPDPSTTMAALDLARIDDLVTSVDRLSDTLTQNLDADLQPMIEARDEVSEFAPGYRMHHVDLGRIMATLEKKKLAPSIVAAIRGCQSVLAATVIQSYAGSDRSGGTWGASGMAIYFPKSGAEYTTDPWAEGGYERGNTYFPVEFVEKHRWTDFLHAYWSRVP